MSGFSGIVDNEPRNIVWCLKFWRDFWSSKDHKRRSEASYVIFKKKHYFRVQQSVLEFNKNLCFCTRQLPIRTFLKIS